MNENIDIDTTFVPDDSASHSWTERDSELVEEYAAQLMAMSICADTIRKRGGRLFRKLRKRRPSVFFIPPGRNASGASVATCVTMLSSRSV